MEETPPEYNTETTKLIDAELSENNSENKNIQDAEPSEYISENTELQDAGPPEYNAENTELQDAISLKDTFFTRFCSPPPWLVDADSAITWMIFLQRILFINWDIPLKLQDYKNQGPLYGFEKYTLLLSLAVKIVNTQFYDLYDEPTSDESSSENEDESAEESEEHEMSEIELLYEDYGLEACFIKCKEALDEMASNEGDTMYSRIGPAMEHVLLATRAHTLAFQGNIAMSKELTKKLKPVIEMSSESRAGIEGIKAKFIMTIHKDVREALKACKVAMVLDPQCAMWPYLTGKLIRRLRREFNEDMVKEELKMFEKAVELERNPKYILFLGQAYQELAELFTRKKYASLHVIDDMLIKCVELYRECWNLKNDSAVICRRVGNGLMKIRQEFIDLSLAKDALLKAVELSPNLVSFHQIGRFYYKHEKDDEKALEYFEKDRNRFTTGEIVRLNLIKDPDYDPEELINYWKLYADCGGARREIVWCDIGWYYLSFKQDLEEAVKYFWKVLINDPFSFRVTEFFSYPFCVHGPLNMLKILVNEIMLLKEKNNVLPQESKRNMVFLENILHKILEKHPELRDIKLRPTLLQSVKNSVESTRNNLRRKRYGVNSNQRDTSRNYHQNSSHNSFTRFSNNILNPGRNNCHRKKVVGNWRQNNNQEKEGQNSESDRNQGTRRSYRENSSDGEMENKYASNWKDNNRYKKEIKYDSNVKREPSHSAGARRQRTDSYNNNRYDVTITDWRSENRSRNNE